MDDKRLHTDVDTPANRRLLCEETAAILAASGMVADTEAMAQLQPLLDGTQSFADNRLVLEAMIKGCKP